MIGIALIALGLLAGGWWFARPRALPAARAIDTAATVTVSVVVPARNEARSLPMLLDSLRRSTVRPYAGRPWRL